jgi:two-component system, chemotaxis family, chemotaxis protein CheY
MQHCFVIDDSDIVRKYARLIFESLNFRVSDAATPAGVAERFSADAADIVIVDWRVPGHNMTEFIASIRTLTLDRRPYIIYLATENDAGDIQRALRAGADDYMMKPFNREIIEMKLHEIRVAA